MPCPIRQFVRATAGWRERMVQRHGGRLIAVPGDTPADDSVPAALRGSAVGSVVETAPASATIMQRCAFRLARYGGAMLAIDYGYRGPAAGDTLQAVKAHEFADPFADPGEVDLTTHVDFTALADAAQSAGVAITGPVGQGVWLRALGIDARLTALSGAAPDRAAELAGQRDRLVEPQAMGELFQVMAATAPGWPRPEGFGASEAAA